MMRLPLHILKKKRMVQLNQQGQVVIESFLCISITVLFVKLLLYCSYLLYVSVVTQHFVYEMNVCQAKTITHNQCMEKKKTKINALLPFGHVHTLKQKKQNKTRHNVLAQTHLRVDVPLPWVRKFVKFNKKSFLHLPLKTKRRWL